MLNPNLVLLNAEKYQQFTHILRKPQPRKVFLSPVEKGTKES